MAPPLSPAAAGLPQGRGGRLDVLDDLTVEGAPGVYAIGDIANIPTPRRPRASAARLGRAAERRRGRRDNLLADLAGKPRKPFHYKDKGIMAMIGRGAAIAEVGPHRHELHGAIAFSAWLGVHAALMTGVRTRIDAFVEWGSDYFSDAPRAAGARPLRRGAHRLARGRRAAESGPAGVG